MANLDLIMGLLLLLNTGAGVLAISRGRTEAERLLVVNFVGTSTVALILLFGTSAEVVGTIDIALLAAVLAPFASLTFARRLWWRPDREREGPR